MLTKNQTDSKNISLPLTPTSSSSSLSPDPSLTDARFFSIGNNCYIYHNYLIYVYTYIII